MRSTMLILALGAVVLSMPCWAESGLVCKWDDREDTRFIGRPKWGLATYEQVGFLDQFGESNYNGKLVSVSYQISEGQAVLLGEFKGVVLKKGESKTWDFQDGSKLSCTHVRHVPETSEAALNRFLYGPGTGF